MSRQRPEAQPLLGYAGLPAKSRRKSGRGPRTPEGLAAVTATIQRVNAARLNIRGAPDDGHGVHSVSGVQPATQALAAEILAILEGDGLGHVRRADRVTAELFAVVLRRVHQAEGYLDRFGLTGKGGAVRPVAQLLVQLLREARGYCEALGMTPVARAKLGLETGRAFDLAAALLAMDASAASRPATKAFEIGESTMSDPKDVTGVLPANPGKTPPGTPGEQGS